MEILGIDIGGTGIKGAPVNVRTGELLGDRVRIETPNPSTPKKIAGVINEIRQQFRWQGRIGVGFPGVVKNGKILTAVNLDKSWVGVDLENLLDQKTSGKAKVINDADAAGLAEMRFGAGKNRRGKVIVLTFGTGIGSALFVDGKLFANTELGHLELHGQDAERRAAERVRIEKNLTWGKWGKRVAEYLEMLERLFSPDLILIGGGASKNYDKFRKSFGHLATEILPAQMGNLAGIVGAALAAGDEKM
ncbi:MAG: ROK family protein [candidate division KSB1 bacterium]|nr:ROK family protein [candidate division KSB1 bacterium]